MPRGFATLKNFAKVTTLAASGGFFLGQAYMLYTSKSLYDRHKYFRFSPKIFDIMKNLCKRAMA